MANHIASKITCSPIGSDRRQYCSQQVGVIFCHLALTQMLNIEGEATELLGNWIIPFMSHAQDLTHGSYLRYQTCQPSLRHNQDIQHISTPPLRSAINTPDTEIIPSSTLLPSPHLPRPPHILLATSLSIPSRPPPPLLPPSSSSPPWPPAPSPPSAPPTASSRSLTSPTPLSYAAGQFATAGVGR